MVTLELLPDTGLLKNHFHQNVKIKQQDFATSAPPQPQREHSRDDINKRGSLL
jgi:hypothetical protein